MVADGPLTGSRPTVLCHILCRCSSDAERRRIQPRCDQAPKGVRYFVLLTLLKGRAAPICPELLGCNMAPRGRAVQKTTSDSESILLECSMRKTNYYGINEQIHHQQEEEERIGLRIHVRGCDSDHITALQMSRGMNMV